MKEALGLVEIRGMSTAIEVADTMVKAANVRIIEMENTRGLGYMTIKVAGDVGAVNAAVDAGKKTGILFDKLISAKVIPRPADGMAAVFCKEEAEEVKEAVKAKANTKPKPKREGKPVRKKEKMNEQKKVLTAEPEQAPPQMEQEAPQQAEQTETKPNNQEE